MLLHLLCNPTQKAFLEIAWIFCIFDNELLWDGKTQEEITRETNLSEMSVQVSEAERRVMQNLMRECESTADHIGKAMQKEFIEKIKRLKLTAQNDPNERLGVAKMLLQERIDSSDAKALAFRSIVSSEAGGSFLAARTMFITPMAAWPFATSKDSGAAADIQPKEATMSLPVGTSRIMLFEAMLLCLADGKISNIEQQLLKEFSQLVRVEDFVFEDLLECAESMNRETLKTISIILE